MSTSATAAATYATPAYNSHGEISSAELLFLSVRELKRELNRYGVSHVTCVEKEELIARVKDVYARKHKERAEKKAEKGRGEMTWRGTYCMSCHVM